MVLSDTTNMPALFAKHPNWHGVIDADPVLAETTRADCSTVPCPTRRSLLATTSRFPQLARSCRTARVIPSYLPHN